MRPGRASRVPTEGAVLNLSTGGISPFETASRPSSLRGMALSTMFGKYIGRRVPGMSFLKPALTLMLMVSVPEEDPRAPRSFRRFRGVVRRSDSRAPCRGAEGAPSFLVLSSCLSRQPDRSTTMAALPCPVLALLLLGRNLGTGSRSALRIFQTGAERDLLG